MFSRAFRALRPTTRAYHSISHPSSNVIVHSKSPEAVLFTKAIDHVTAHGFTRQAVDLAVRDLSYLDLIQSAITASLGHTVEFLFVHFWLRLQRQKLHDHVMDPVLPLHQIKNEYDRAAYLLNTRLRYNLPVLGQLSGALAQLVVPYNVAASLEELHNLSDDIAFYAGDMSNDTAWYAKRLLLSSIYVKLELFLLQDNSPNLTKTSEYVNSSVDAVRTMGYAYTSVEQWAIFNAISLVNLIRSQLARG